MEQIRQHQTTKIWRLVGLTGLALSVAFLLNEAQARELPMPSPIHPLNIHSTHPISMTSKTHPSEKNRTPHPSKFTNHSEAGSRERDNEDKTQKKRLGLAILFLGTLAEKS
ncbi:hypothetical protein [Candidatus Nitrospira allomarina]|uniref:Uncharacterized protein n=1 Tax=Candidatus Nitrospira allomarina TaxID=3020900 RepID=A0AA96GEP1_9BACT|nr:hypothetical protein [Candidatus Nitrospira allomarina]WNM59792.1 hypothetical protein PP769_08570 [Candidatus Nitrospira allomarina]